MAIIAARENFNHGQYFICANIRHSANYRFKTSSSNFCSPLSYNSTRIYNLYSVILILYSATFSVVFNRRLYVIIARSVVTSRHLCCWIAAKQSSELTIINLGTGTGC